MPQESEQTIGVTLDAWECDLIARYCRSTITTLAMIAYADHAGRFKDRDAEMTRKLKKLAEKLEGRSPSV